MLDLHWSQEVPIPCHLSPSFPALPKWHLTATVWAAVAEEAQGLAARPVGTSRLSRVGRRMPWSLKLFDAILDVYVKNIPTSQRPHFT